MFEDWWQSLDTDLSYPQPCLGDQWLGHARNIHLVTMSKVLQTRILHLQEYLHRSNLHHLLPAPLELSQLGHPHRQSCWPSNRNKTVRKYEPKRGAISRVTLTSPLVFHRNIVSCDVCVCDVCNVIFSDDQPHLCNDSSVGSPPLVSQRPPLVSRSVFSLSEVPQLSEPHPLIHLEQRQGYIEQGK